MKLELIERDVYLMPGWKSYPFSGQKVLAAIQRNFDGQKKQEAVFLFLSFSVKHSTWCGVTWPRLSEEMRKHCQSTGEFRALKQMFEGMLREGLLEIPGQKTWWERILHKLSVQVIFPTKLLLDKFRLQTAPSGGLE